MAAIRLEIAATHGLEFCGKCEHVDSWTTDKREDCVIFKQPLHRGIAGEFKRLPECIEAEVKA